MDTIELPLNQIVPGPMLKSSQTEGAGFGEHWFYNVLERGCVYLLIIVGMKRQSGACQQLSIFFY